MIDVLKCYFPLILLLKPAKIYADWVVEMVVKWPLSASAMKKIANGLRASGLQLLHEDVLLRTSALRAIAISQQLVVLNAAIVDYQRKIKALLRTHASYRVVKSLPCGDISRARILAALGDDHSRYQSASQIASMTGIAPLTEQSGKQRFVHSRWACSHFLRQTFHEFARVSVSRCAWDEAYYMQQIDNGKSAQMAYRALAFKWIRIIFRCWQTGEPYLEERYHSRLVESNSPLANRINAEKGVNA